MTVRFVQWTLDVADVDRMAEFWAAALGYRIDKGDDGNAKLYPPDTAPVDVPTLWLQATATPPAKNEKNRNHPDLRPAGGDVEAEVERLIGLGARPGRRRSVRRGSVRRAGRPGGQRVLRAPAGAAPGLTGGFG